MVWRHVCAERFRVPCPASRPEGFEDARRGVARRAIRAVRACFVEDGDRCSWCEGDPATSRAVPCPPSLELGMDAGVYVSWTAHLPRGRFVFIAEAN